jgi:hypothetical protein
MGTEVLWEHRGAQAKTRAEKHRGVVYAAVHVRHIRGGLDEYERSVGGVHLAGELGARGEVRGRPDDVVAGRGHLRCGGMGREELVAVTGSLMDGDRLGEPPIGVLEVARPRVEDREYAQPLGHDLADVCRPAELHRFFCAPSCEVMVLCL